MIGAVLVAVFVPVAFFGGTTGRLLPQFSLTIAFAVVLSVFNAVTYASLSALLLDRESHVHGRLDDRPHHRGRHHVLHADQAGPRAATAHARALRFLGLLGRMGALQDRPIRVRAGRGWSACSSAVVQAPADFDYWPTAKAEICKKEAERVLFADPDIMGLLGGGFQLQRRSAEQRADLHTLRPRRSQRARHCSPRSAPCTCPRRRPGRRDDPRRHQLHDIVQPQAPASFSATACAAAPRRPRARPPRTATRPIMQNHPGLRRRTPPGR